MDNQIIFGRLVIWFRQKMSAVPGATAGYSSLKTAQRNLNL